jgi:hypothetical protein
MMTSGNYEFDRCRRNPFNRPHILRRMKDTIVNSPRAPTIFTIGSLLFLFTVIAAPIGCQAVKGAEVATVTTLHSDRWVCTSHQGDNVHVINPDFKRRCTSWEWK